MMSHHENDMTLTPAEKRKLKARGQTLPEHARIGQEAPSPAQLQHLRQLLSLHELVKVRFAEIQGAEREAFADGVARSLDAVCIHVLGRTMLLYKPGEDRDPSSPRKSAD